MSQSVVELKQISKSFTDGLQLHQVLDQISLTIEQGETVALTGPSGSGKSTLLNLIGGFEHYDTGELRLNNVATSSWQDQQWSQYRRSQLGVIFQQFNLLSPLTVANNIQFQLSLNQHKWNDWCDYLSDKLGLKELLNRHIDTLSGGQQQRVAIARALAHKPSLILADEPTGNLDFEAGQEVMQLLCSLAADANSSILMVTHSEECANFMSRRWHLRRGHIHE
ncbi:ABC transporter ATP-binding protein [Shewanella marina]|uniref:ABC transporter ATP-binding protein n=1 Tax=Shewanella marina TaxID=487319 RepID=UPI00046F20EE|nr:ABC transporter ATP-binding protein [Shewanella marina]